MNTHVLRTNTPSATAALWNTILRVSEKVSVWHQQRINRAAFNQMLTLDDRILEDIGVSRQDIEWASNLPIELNAGEVLGRCKKRARLIS